MFHSIADNARVSQRRKTCVRGKDQEIAQRPNGLAESLQAANHSYRQSSPAKRVPRKGKSHGNCGKRISQSSRLEFR